MRLPVGAVVFVSHRLKRAVFRVSKVLCKKYLATNVAGKIFSPNLKGLTLQTREEHVTTFAYWNDKNDFLAGGLLNEEDLLVGKQGKSSCSPFNPLGNCLCGREKQVCREFTFRYSCAGFQRLFSRKTVCDAMHRWRFGECARGKNKEKRTKKKSRAKYSANIFT